MGAHIMNEDERRKLPEPQKVHEAGEVLLKDKDGKKEIAFESLFTGKPEDQRQLIIFIRHFFCGVSLLSHGPCGEYLEERNF